VLTTGVVVSGRGKGAKRIAEFAPKLAVLLGERPLSGTLNVLLSRPMEFDTNRAISVIDGKRFFWRISLNGVPCLAYRWRGCPLHVVEVVSHRCLRTDLGLTEGSAVEIDAYDAKRASLPRLFAWASLWAFRRGRYYTSQEYVLRTKRFRKIWSWSTQRD